MKLNKKRKKISRPQIVRMINIKIKPTKIKCPQPKLKDATPPNIPIYISILKSFSLKNRNHIVPQKKTGSIHKINRSHRYRP